MGKMYKLYFNSTSSSNAAASLKVTRKARIRCIHYSSMGIAGGAIDGIMQIELAKQNTANIQTNDTPETVLGTFSIAAPVNAGAFAGNLAAVCDLPVDVGDTLYANTLRSGTSFTAAYHQINIYTD